MLAEYYLFFLGLFAESHGDLDLRNQLITPLPSSFPTASAFFRGYCRHSPALDLEIHLTPSLLRKPVFVGTHTGGMLTVSCIY